MEANPGWTEARCDMLARLWRAGRSFSQIADALGGITRSAVAGKVHRIYGPSRPMSVRRTRKRSAPYPTTWSAEEDATLRELWRDGVTVAVIAMRLRKTANAVVGRRKRLGLPKRNAAACVRRGVRRPQGLQFRKGPSPMPKEKPSPIPPLNLTLGELRPRIDVSAPAQCRWITDDTRDAVRFCGHETQGGAWCAFHKALVFTSGRKAAAR